MDERTQQSLRLATVPGDRDRLVLCYRPEAFSEEEAREILDQVVTTLKAWSGRY